ncbi:MAG: DUF1338 domain-containing protein [Rubripirellula sp.]
MPALNSTTLQFVLAGLMRRYQLRVPNVQRILDLMIQNQLINSVSDIENDHIAFRTMGVPRLGLQSLEKVFLHYGYERRDAYHFEGKKLDAFWYAPPEPCFPRIFVSELRVGDLSNDAQRIIHSYTDQVSSDPVEALNLDDGIAVDDFLHHPLWRTPTLSDYEKLLAESEYASWVIYNRYYLNHFTVSIHNLPTPFNTVEEFNRLLQANGIRLNVSGGAAKVSADGLLIQSSTVAGMVDAEFDDGAGGTAHHQIPGSYVEFAERKVLPKFASLPAAEVGREHRRDGFETGNADRIFESTYRSQQTK